MSTLFVVVNPASGQDQAVLATVDRVCREHDTQYDLQITHGAGDARRLAERALAAGAQVVAAYGGDGTVSETASALVGTQTPLAILPGGTGNVVAQELGVPLDLAAAMALACGAGAEPREVDVMESGGRHFLLRIGIGADARMIHGASRERKEELGWFAYLWSAIEALREHERARYTVEVDGERIETEALTCLLANVGRIGRGGFSLSRSIRPWDGRLNVIVIRDSDLGTVATVGARLLGLAEDDGEPVEERSPEASVLHVLGERVRVVTDPPQPVHGDGEELGETPFDVRLLPAALRVLLPRAPAPGA